MSHHEISDLSSSQFFQYSSHLVYQTNRERLPKQAIAAIPEAGAAGVNSLDIVKAMMMGTSKTAQPQEPRATSPQRIAPEGTSQGTPGALAVAGSAPGGPSTLSREQKVQMLWGSKKSESGSAVVQALVEPSKVDASSVFGHNRWDVAEFER
jgi:hypothetical protein